jgi:hypothetical protein
MFRRLHTTRRAWLLLQACALVVNLLVPAPGALLAAVRDQHPLHRAPQHHEMADRTHCPHAAMMGMEQPQDDGCPGDCPLVGHPWSGFTSLVLPPASGPIAYWRMGAVPVPRLSLAPDPEPPRPLL